MDPLFAAMQSIYAKNPIGKVSFTNIEKNSITDVEVSFFQTDFMDSPTPAAVIDEIGPGETIEDLKETEALFGCTTTGASNPWSGFMAHAALWKTPLTEPQVLSLATV